MSDRFECIRECCLELRDRPHSVFLHSKGQQPYMSEVSDLRHLKEDNKYHLLRHNVLTYQSWTTGCVHSLATYEQAPSSLIPALNVIITARHLTHSLQNL